MASVLILIPTSHFTDETLNILTDHGYGPVEQYVRHSHLREHLKAFENECDEDAGESVCNSLLPFPYYSTWSEGASHYYCDSGAEYHIPNEGTALLNHCTPMVKVDSEGNVHERQLAMCKEYYRLAIIFAEVARGDRASGPPSDNGDALSRLG